METEFLQQEYSAPKSLFDLLPPMPKKRAKGMGERQQLICKIAFELGIPAQYRSGIFWQSKDLTNSELEKLKEESLQFKANPGALFRKKLKAMRLAIKEKLNETNPT